MSSIRIYAPLSTPIEIGKDKLDELCASVLNLFKIFIEKK